MEGTWKVINEETGNRMVLAELRGEASCVVFLLIPRKEIASQESAAGGVWVSIQTPSREKISLPRFRDWGGLVIY